MVARGLAIKGPWALSTRYGAYVRALVEPAGVPAGRLRL